MNGPPKPRQLFANVNALPRGGGSPINVHVKRSVTSMPRPRKQFRRSLSMFEHPGDVMKQEKEYVPSGLQSIMDVDEFPTLRLPHFIPDGDRPEHGSLPRINHDTMINVLDGKYTQQYDKTMIVDCRFEYEYDGGHIQGAMNYNDKEQLAKAMFTEASPNTLVIFHCEYSNHRAPLMWVTITRSNKHSIADTLPGLPSSVNRTALSTRLTTLSSRTLKYTSLTVAIALSSRVIVRDASHRTTFSWTMPPTRALANVDLED